MVGNVTAPTEAVLVVRPSSLGDIVHALTIVADIRAHRPDLAIDWVAESGFVGLLELHPGIRRIVPVGMRQWRHRAFVNKIEIQLPIRIGEFSTAIMRGDKS